MSSGSKNLVVMPNGDLVPGDVFAKLPDAEAEHRRTSHVGGTSKPYLVQHAPPGELGPVGEKPTPYAGPVATYGFVLTLAVGEGPEVWYWRYAGCVRGETPNVGTEHLTVRLA